MRRFSAGIFLILFAFCVTPKRTLHDLLANHSDGQRPASLPHEQLASSGFHCHADDLVVVAPYLPGADNPETAPLIFTIYNFAEPISSAGSILHTHTDSRGPPASFCS